MSQPEKTVLVLQGGGALGAYQAGAFQRLTQDNPALDWVAGISIGAINAAIICGNPPERRVERLETFWHDASSTVPWTPVLPSRAAREMFADYAASAVLMRGVNGFFKPRPPQAYVPWPMNHTLSFYDTAPLKDTLNALVDFDYLNDAGPRLSVGAVDIATGNFVYFDSATSRIDARHIMASGALPPGFPPVEIDGRLYWDGGLVSNTPLQYVMDHDSVAPMCIFQLDLFSARGALPETLDQVQQRDKDIRYSSRTRLTTDRYRQLQAIREAVETLAAKLPPEVLAEMQSDPDLEFLRSCGTNCPVTLVHLIHRKESFEGTAKDYEFSRLSMTQHWDAGFRDVERTLTSTVWQARDPSAPGLQVIDIGASKHQAPAKTRKA